MQTTTVNPVTWSKALGFQQGVLVEGQRRTLYVSGQTAMDAEGRPQHEGDMAAQLALTLDNLEAVLADAGMGLHQVVHLRVFATDLDALLEHYGVAAARLGAARVESAMTMVGVTRLAVPGQMVEIEATAVG